MSSTLLLGNESPADTYLLKNQEKIVQVACGSIHTLARSSMHRIFSCGNGSTYALGHKTRESCSTFKQIDFFNGAEDGLLNVGVKTVACGLSHSGCVLTDGNVYLWGIIGDIQQSKENMDKAILKKPLKISFKSANDPNNGSMSHRRRSNVAEDASSVFIDDIRLGEQFSLALTNKGTVYSWGLNDKG